MLENFLYTLYARIIVVRIREIGYKDLDLCFNGEEPGQQRYRLSSTSRSSIEGFTSISISQLKKQWTKHERSLYGTIPGFNPSNGYMVYNHFKKPARGTFALEYVDMYQGHPEHHGFEWIKQRKRTWSFDDEDYLLSHKSDLILEAYSQPGKLIPVLDKVLDNHRYTSFGDLVGSYISGLKQIIDQEAVNSFNRKHGIEL